jgi:UDP-glucose 4-epimerase
VKIIVCGAGGFIGQHVVAKLRAAGHDVQPSSFMHNMDPMRGGIQKGVDCVIHLAGTLKPAEANEEIVYDVESNVHGSLLLLRSCVDAGVKSLVFASSGGTVYGSPASLPVPEWHPTLPLCAYGVSKLMVEHYCRLFSQLHGLSTTCLRLANVYGPGQQDENQGAVSVFMRRARDGQPITIWGDGSVVRDYVYVDDVSEAFRLAVEKPKPGHRVLNIGSEVGTSLLQLLQVVERVTGIKPAVNFCEPRGWDVPANYLDSSLAETVLGWIPMTTLDGGVRKTWGSLVGEKLCGVLDAAFLGFATRAG